MTPTALSLSELRKTRWTAEVVEKWIPKLNRRKDFIGVVDIIAFQPGEPITAIQATSLANISSRIQKAAREPRLRQWLKAGGVFQVWGWLKRDGRWQVRKTPIVLDDLKGIAVIHPERRKRAKAEPLLFGSQKTPHGCNAERRNEHRTTLDTPASPQERSVAVDATGLHLEETR